MIAAGTAAHGDHGRAVAELLLDITDGKAKDYSIKDEEKAKKLALELSIDVDGREINDIVRDVAQTCLDDFGRQRGGEVSFIKRAPEKRQQLWRELGVLPRGIDREVAETMNRTTMGVDQNAEHLLLQGARTALANGWGGSMIATELQDILFGTPKPIIGKVNLGVFKDDHVNIVVHGHEPVLSEMIVAAVQNPEIIKEAETAGAKGIQLAGICCTSNELLMRHEIPSAGNFLQQEIAIMTGAVDAMIVDVQCVLPSLPKVADCYHTRIITTSPKAKIDGAEHIEFDEENALECAKEIVKIGIHNYKNRPETTNIPDHQQDFVAGFSHETINYMLGGRFRASYRPLNDNIINGRIRGVAGVVGCNTPKVTQDWALTTMIKELLKNDVLVLVTGCGALAAAKYGLCVPEAAPIYCGAGLAEVCETVGMPPVLHMGACVDNTRILTAASEMVREGGLGNDISDLPVAGAAPEWMSEKAVAIGQYFVSSGVFTVFGSTWPTLGAEGTTKELFEGMEEKYGGKWAFEPDPEKAARLMIEHIDKKRKALGIDKARERILVDMQNRRELANV